MFVPTERRDVVALDPQRQDVELERRLQLVERLDALLAGCARPSAARVSSASLALRSASSRSWRLSPRSAARTSTGAAAALGQQREAERLGSSSSTSGWTITCAGIAPPDGVVLGDELLGDLPELALALVLR